MTQLAVDQYTFLIEGDLEGFETSLTSTRLQPGLFQINLKLQAAASAVPPVMKLSWKHPIIDIHGLWHPMSDRSKKFHADWEQGFSTKATSSAPVVCLFNLNGYNRLTYAFSDAASPLTVKAGVNEESAFFHCSITLFGEPTAAITTYEASLLLDTRELPYYESLDDVQRWWAELPGMKPAFVPEIARNPMYSTWYSYHQNLSPEQVEKQCRLAKLLGCEAVIVDDGWQTSDNKRGYAYCGDWEVSPDKFPDMRAHVDRVHRLGMKYILWYSVPFIGFYSEAWSAFKDKTLYTNERQKTGVLDPRFPEVREFLISTYEKAVRDWDLDGLKLDFVDNFYTPKDDKAAKGDGRDYLSVPEAADRLLTDVIGRLRRLKPDILIEFRQKYIGPLMRKYGNMFRASDCPNDAIQNRVRIVDVRLLAGTTATHSDMLMWHPEEPVESAAMQILHILYSVPQISVLLDRLPQDHLKMVTYLLDFWKRHRDVLLDGKFEPLHPELLYPLVSSTLGEKKIITAYHDQVVTCGSTLPTQLIIVNGTLKGRLILEFMEEQGEMEMEVHSCTGEVVNKVIIVLRKGLYTLEVPTAGIAYLTRKE